MATRKRKPEPPRERPKLKKCGALWLSEGRNGKFMSGRIDLDDNNEMRILVFKNDYKEEDKHPDYQIFEIPSEDEREAVQRKFIPTNDDVPI